MKTICKKCLLAELDYDEEFSHILDYVAQIPPEKRVDENEYQRRLNLCKSCEQLVNGICAECGCYVELRAVKPAMYCAGKHKLW